MRVGQSCMHLEWCLGSTQGVQLSLPGQICCFPCALQLLSLQYLLPFPSGEAVLTLGRSRAWVQSRFCRGSSSPFAVTLLLLPSPGQWFSCRGCSRWRGCPGTGGTAINSRALRARCHTGNVSFWCSRSGLLLCPWKTWLLGSGCCSGFCSLVPHGLEKGQDLQHLSLWPPNPDRC